MPDETTPPPITADPEEQELLTGLGVSLTAPKVDEEPETTPEPEAASAADAVPAADEGTQAAEPTEPEEAAAAPVPAAAAPAEPAEPEKPAAVVVTTQAPEPDDIEKDLGAAIEAVAADDLLTDGQKAAERARLKAQLATYQRDRRADAAREQQEQQAERDNFWRTEAQSRGVKKEQLQQIWDATLAAYAKKYPKADPATYQIAAMEQYEKAVTAAKAKPPEPAGAVVEPPKGPKVAPPAAKTPITPAGAKVAPPAGNIPPAAPRAKTEEDELLEYVRKVPGGIKSLVS